METLDTKIDKSVNKIVSLYNEIENELLLEIARHLKFSDEFLNADYWRLQKLEELGLLNQDVVKFLARYTKKSEQEVINAMNNIGYETYNIDKLNRAFEDEMISIDPKTLLENNVIATMIEKVANATNGNLLNISNKIAQATRSAYINAIEKTYLEITSGNKSYQEALLSSINTLSKDGIRMLDYQVVDDTGEVIGIRHYDIVGTIRRDVLTNARQLSNDINMKVVEELEPKYIKLSEHIDCRPQHFDWQGTIIKREDLVKVTRYGEVDGLGGINCRHYFEPYFGDKRGSEEKEYTKEQCLDRYDETQQQRYLERGIRTWKRKKELLEEADYQDKDTMKVINQKIKLWEQRYRTYSEEHNIKRDITRTTIK